MILEEHAENVSAIMNNVCMCILQRPMIVAREIIACIARPFRLPPSSFVVIVLSLRNYSMGTGLMHLLYSVGQVRGSVLQTLASVKMEDLPVVIKFLLQSVNNQDAVEVYVKFLQDLFNKRK